MDGSDHRRLNTYPTQNGSTYTQKDAVMSLGGGTYNFSDDAMVHGRGSLGIHGGKHTLPHTLSSRLHVSGGMVVIDGEGMVAKGDVRVEGGMVIFTRRAQNVTALGDVTVAGEAVVEWADGYHTYR